MVTKDQVIKSLKDMPDQFSIDELMDKLILLQKIENRIRAIEERRGLFYSGSQRNVETMVKVNWTRRAIEDIYEISEYYKPRSEKYAEQLTIKIFEKTDNLDQYPQLGRMVPEVERPEIRELIYKNYRIIYNVVSDDQIDILAVHNSLRPLSEDSIFD